MRKRSQPTGIERVEGSTGRHSYRRVERTDDAERVVVWLDASLAAALDAFVTRCSYDSRSDAVREMIRARVHSRDGARTGRAGTQAAHERRRRAHDLDEGTPKAADAAASVLESEQTPMTTEQLLVAKFGPTMTYAELATVLKRREGGLRQTLYVGRAPWCRRLIAARLRIGRRSCFRTALVAAFLEEFAETDLSSVD